MSVEIEVGLENAARVKPLSEEQILLEEPPKKGLANPKVRGLLIIGGELLHLDQEGWWHRSKLVPYGETLGDWLRAMVGEKGDPWAKLERLTGVKVRPN